MGTASAIVHRRLMPRTDLAWWRGLQSASPREGSPELDGAEPRAGAIPRAARRSAVTDLVTTPGVLRLAMVVLTIGLVVFGAVAARAVLDRRDATVTVGQGATPLVISAQDLYVALAAADAGASTAFLEGGVEPPARRASYLADIEAAAQRVVDTASRADLSPAGRQALTTINEQLPVYAGAIDSARANNRQDFPVGASYLRQASALMQTNPARLEHRVRRGGSPARPGTPRRDGRSPGRRHRRRGGRHRRVARPDTAVRGATDATSDQPRSRRSDGGHRGVGRGHGGHDRRTTARTGGVAGGRIGSARAPVGRPDPRLAVLERREPRPDRTGHRGAVHRGLQQGHRQHRPSRRHGWTAR